MAEKDLKKCSTFLVSRKIYLIPVRMTKIKGSSTAHAGKDVEQGEHSPIGGGSTNLYNLSGNQSGSFLENWK